MVKSTPLLQISLSKMIIVQSRLTGWPVETWGLAGLFHSVSVTASWPIQAAAFLSFRRTFSLIQNPPGNLMWVWVCGCACCPKQKTAAIFFRPVVFRFPVFADCDKVSPKESVGYGQSVWQVLINTDTMVCVPVKFSQNIRFSSHVLIFEANPLNSGRMKA